MIQFIHGILEETGDNFIVVEAGGVGYGINVPGSVLTELPAKGTEVRIFTHFSVREDGQTLYGFLYREDREMFRSLLGVNGVGPKMALGILSVLRPDDLRMSVMTGDVKSISRAPGVGNRTAQRIILELKDKLGDLSLGRLAEGLAGNGRTDGQPGREAGPVAEAIEALSALGYSRIEAGRAVGSIALTEDMTTQDVLKAALKMMRS